jgi:Fur family iron response transcriptional regulator
MQKEIGQVESLTREGIAELLRSNGISLTLQRLAIAQILLAKPVHLTAEQVLKKAQEIMPEISRATGYNTLNLLKDKGLIRELVIEPGRVIYDSNTSHHYHIYDADTGEMTDVPAGDLKVTGTADLPPGLVLEEVDIIIRVHSRQS